MRICSFLPSATEIVYALGLEDQLYGVTHECDFPAAAKNKPWVVRSVFEGMDPQPTSGEISRVISERLSQGLGIYDIDQDLLRSAQPDLILTQAICEV
jgi:iron complex transport system substrate-binding protein